MSPDLIRQAIEAQIPYQWDDWAEYTDLFACQREIELAVLGGVAFDDAVASVVDAIVLELEARHQEENAHV